MRLKGTLWVSTEAHKVWHGPLAGERDARTYGATRDARRARAWLYTPLERTGLDPTEGRWLSSTPGGSSAVSDLRRRTRLPPRPCARRSRGRDRRTGCLVQQLGGGSSWAGRGAVRQARGAPARGAGARGRTNNSGAGEPARDVVHGVVTTSVPLGRQFQESVRQVMASDRPIARSRQTRARPEPSRILAAHVGRRELHHKLPKPRIRLTTPTIVTLAASAGRDRCRQR